MPDRAMPDRAMPYRTMPDMLLPLFLYSLMVRGEHEGSAKGWTNTAFLTEREGYFEGESRGKYWSWAVYGVGVLFQIGVRLPSAFLVARGERHIRGRSDSCGSRLRDIL